MFVFAMALSIASHRTQFHWVQQNGNWWSVLLGVLHYGRWVSGTAESRSWISIARAGAYSLSLCMCLSLPPPSLHFLHSCADVLCVVNNLTHDDLAVLFYNPFTPSVALLEICSRRSENGLASVIVHP